VTRAKRRRCCRRRTRLSLRLAEKKRAAGEAIADTEKAVRGLPAARRLHATSAEQVLEDRRSSACANIELLCARQEEVRRAATDAVVAGHTEELATLPEQADAGDGRRAGRAGRHCGSTARESDDELQPALSQVRDDALARIAEQASLLAACRWMLQLLVAARQEVEAAAQAVASAERRGDLRRGQRDERAKALGEQLAGLAKPGGSGGEVRPPSASKPNSPPGRCWPSA
jgi:hypothetical protein